MKKQLKEIILHRGEKEIKLKVIEQKSPIEFLVECHLCSKGAYFYASGKLYCEHCSYLEFFI